MFRLSIEQAEYHLDAQPLFKPVTLVLQPKRCCHLQGKNGVGKTTLMHILLNHLPLTYGSMHWEDHRPEATAHPPISYIGHTLGLHPDLTVAENSMLRLSLDHPNAKLDASYMQTLRDFHLQNHLETPISALSAGQRMRLAWSVLLHEHRPIWLLDEAFTHLDHHTFDQIAHHIQQHCAQGGAVLYTSHAHTLAESQPIHMVFAND